MISALLDALAMPGDYARGLLAGGGVPALTNQMGGW